MELIKNKDETSLDVKVIGRLDTNTAPILEKELSRDLPDIKELTFDFEELFYVSSAGLRIILSTQKTMNVQGKMIIKNVNDLVMEVFDATGFVDILTIE
ncbi:anti-sigma F factor antagonist [Methanobrevibacter cuticularis]|uniref:Anti-sigma F factor antagonist n=1 Tax=Methanobrevibacter cuticularis TaxID=47311 RepID=A0A166ENN4_9EURY|nr:STAS domain-containing protein [Methanobrevibacter cuticularis]KZX16849.1 anti-sigma F factor antagonist [Methanobrevibacter cuticularis]